MSKSILVLLRASALNRGMTTGIENLAWGLGRRGHSVTIVSGGQTPIHIPEEYKIPDAIAYHFVGITSRNSQLFQTINHKALQLLSDNPSDCIISRSSTVLPILRDRRLRNKLPAVFINEGANIPKRTPIQYARQIRHYGIWGFLADEITRFAALQNVQHAVAISHSVAKSLQEVNGFPAHKISVIYRGVDTETFLPPDRKNGPSGHVFRLLFAGNVTPSKGVTDLVASLEYLETTFSGIELVLCGSIDPTYRAKLETMSRGHRLTITGPLKQDELVEEYQKADAFVLPSHSEGLGKVVIEAMACSLPVVCTDIPAFTEIIENEQNGLIVPLGNPRGIARAIDRLRHYPEMAERLANRGRQTVLENFSLEKELDEWEELISRSFCR